MRSSRSALVAVIVLAVGCGDDTSEPAVSACSTLTYQNFGEPFVLDWCRGCHSSGLPDDMRQGAPLDVNFDDLDHVRAWSVRIATRSAGPLPTMPPAAGPSQEERDMLAEWIQCGMR